jgi:hypothetical protein
MLLMHLLFFSSFWGSLAAPTFTCIGVTHRADHSEAVSGSGHVQVAYERVKGLGTDMTKRLRDVRGCHYFESVHRRYGRKALDDDGLVIDQQELGFGHRILLGRRDKGPQHAVGWTFGKL